MSDFDAGPRCIGEDMVDGQFTSNWYVYWWRRDGTAHGARGEGLTLAAATRLANDIRAGKVKP